jgi:hypothetical protein
MFSGAALVTSGDLSRDMRSCVPRRLTGSSIEEMWFLHPSSCVLDASAHRVHQAIVGAESIVKTIATKKPSESGQRSLNKSDFAGGAKTVHVDDDIELQGVPPPQVLVTILGV